MLYWATPAGHVFLHSDVEIRHQADTSQHAMKRLVWLGLGALFVWAKSLEPSALTCTGLRESDDSVGTSLAFVKASNLVTCPSNQNCDKVWSDPSLHVDFLSFGVTNNGRFVTGMSFSGKLGSGFDNSSTDAFPGSSLGVSPKPGTTGYASLQVPILYRNVTFTGCHGTSVGGKVYIPTQNFVNINYMSTNNTTNENQANPPMLNTALRQAPVPENAVSCSGAEIVSIDAYPRMGIRTSDIISCPMGNNNCPVPRKALQETFYSYAHTYTGLPVSGFDLGKAVKIQSQRIVHVQAGDGSYVLKPGQTGYEMVYINMVGASVVFTGCDRGDMIGGKLYAIKPDQESYMLELTKSRNPDQDAPTPADDSSVAGHAHISVLALLGIATCVSLVVTCM